MLPEKAAGVRGGTTGTAFPDACRTLPGASPATTRRNVLPDMKHAAGTLLFIARFVILGLALAFVIGARITDRFLP